MVEQYGKTPEWAACEGERFEYFPTCPSVAGVRLLATIVCELRLDLRRFITERPFFQSELNVYKRLPNGYGVMPRNVVKLCRKPVWFGASVPTTVPPFGTRHKLSWL